MTEEMGTAPVGDVRKCQAIESGGRASEGREIRTGREREAGEGGRGVRRQWEEK
jgi:hypothetical protein